MITMCGLDPPLKMKKSRNPPRVLDLLLQGELLDIDIDCAVDAHIADPSGRSYVLHSLYLIDFGEIAAALPDTARLHAGTADRKYRQALMCALLLHRPRRVRSSAAEQNG
ncbi:MAG: hypothetical protein K2X71_12690 [Methylobacterium sp.]|jgi:hypothetical protein|uniref:hypothetical protein n=1 Tax=Methylobacterium sp. TaxID=409 RepID=UPI002590FA74|nr:hypothetical protein [Methylobacterium sp.]MBY0296873.1 hypothetical protein [Methylobacterium sp.]